MVRYAAESGSELSCGDATGTNTMAEIVSASAVAKHFDCSRAYVGKLEAEGVIQRHGSGFPLDQSRAAYLRFLRRERRQSPRMEADAAHVAVRTEMLQLMEKKRELVHRTDVVALIDKIAGTVLTHLRGMSARCSRDMQVRRNIDAVVRQVRTKIAEACSKIADECGEPPLEQQ
jgi:hypothetical protein